MMKTNTIRCRWNLKIEMIPGDDGSLYFNLMYCMASIPHFLRIMSSFNVKMLITQEQIPRSTSENSPLTIEFVSFSRSLTNPPGNGLALESRYSFLWGPHLQMLHRPPPPPCSRLPVFESKISGPSLTRRHPSWWARVSHSSQQFAGILQTATAAPKTQSEIQCCWYCYGQFADMVTNKLAHRVY